MANADRSAEQFRKMTETPIPKLILSLAAPTILSMLITSIYNLADTFFVGQISTSASGAVGIVSSLMAILQALGFMLGHGSGSIISRSLGSQNTDAATRFASNVDGLRSEGIATSIDDFGTGYSSLNMIKKVDLNVIKIDKSFIPMETEYPGKETDMVMFVSIVDLVRKLGKKTIAEGVETKEQLRYLRQVGCDIVQGYVFDKPMPESEFEVRLEQGYKDEE